MQEDAYRAWLGTLLIVDKTTGNQTSRVHRLEAAFGDLDSAFDLDAMAAVIAALQYSRADAKASKPLPAGIVSDGDYYRTMATLRHAAVKYRTFRLAQAASQPAVIFPERFAPLASPKTAEGRSIKPTGFWMRSERW